MPPRRRITNIAKLLPRKRTSASEPAQETIPPVSQRDCASLPAGIGASDDGLLEDSVGKFAGGPQTSDDAYPEVHDLLNDRSTLDVRDLRVHRFAQRYESTQLRSYRDYLSVEEDVSPRSSKPHQEISPTSYPVHPSEQLDTRPEETCSSCNDLSSLRHELALLRENHELLADTTRKTLRLAETLEARVESMQRGARPGERLFWMLIDSLVVVVLFLLSMSMRPWAALRKRFVTERVQKRRSWRLSAGNLENDPFLGDVAKRLSFSAADE